MPFKCTKVQNTKAWGFSPIILRPSLSPFLPLSLSLSLPLSFSHFLPPSSSLSPSPSPSLSLSLSLSPSLSPSSITGCISSRFFYSKPLPRPAHLPGHAQFPKGKKSATESLRKWRVCWRGGTSPQCRYNINDIARARIERWTRGRDGIICWPIARSSRGMHVMWRYIHTLIRQ